jgi:flavin-dependent dehydrogenase
LDKRGAIYGVGANLSFEYAEKCYANFIKTIKLPACKLDHIEKGFTPYHRAPYSLVTNGFICMGDAACMTKPYSGEGITAA